MGKMRDHYHVEENKPFYELKIIDTTLQKHRQTMILRQIIKRKKREESQKLLHPI